MIQCLKRSCSVNVLAVCQALLVRGNAPAPRKPEVQNDDENSFHTPAQSLQGPTKFQKNPSKE